MGDGFRVFWILVVSYVVAGVIDLGFFFFDLWVWILGEADPVVMGFSFLMGCGVLKADGFVMGFSLLMR